MRRFLFIIMALCLLGGAALAEIPCQCGQDACQCFIQLGDEGMAVEFIQNELVAQGYLAANDDASDYDEATVKAVMAFQEAHSLPATGMMDDETLTLLLWGLLPDELDVKAPASNGRPVWIPTDGGIRRHVKSTCSSMFNSRLISVRNAEIIGMLPCGRCNRNGTKE